MEDEARQNAKIEAALQAQIDQLIAQYEQRKVEIDAELQALREKYAHLIAEEQARLDELIPEVEAILNNKQINDNARLSIEQFQREREQRRKSLKAKEQQSRLSKKKTKQVLNEHYVDRGISQNYTETEHDHQCDKLFSTVPIEFEPRNIPLEQAMQEIIAQQHVVIPIIHIREKLYLIGSGRMTCDFRSDTAMVKVGGGYERFEEYVAKNERYHQKKLVTYMINNQASLEWVVGQLIEGKNIQTGVSNIAFRTTGTKKSTSPARKPSMKRNSISPTSNKKFSMKR